MSDHLSLNSWTMWRLARSLLKEKSQAAKQNRDFSKQVKVPMREHITAHGGYFHPTALRAEDEGTRTCIEEFLNRVFSSRGLTATVTGLRWHSFEDGPQGSFSTYTVVAQVT